jgi:hypothetical protein
MVNQYFIDTGLLYDPPEGWRYGFPKVYKPLRGEKVWQTLLRDGYSVSCIKLGMDKYVRFIGERENFEYIPKGNYEDEPIHIRNAIDFPND